MPRFDQEKMIRLVSEFRKSVIRLKKLKKLGKKNFLVTLTRLEVQNIISLLQLKHVLI